METKNVVQADTEVKLLLDTLVKLEQQLEEYQPYISTIQHTCGNYATVLRYRRNVDYYTGGKPVVQYRLDKPGGGQHSISSQAYEGLTVKATALSALCLKYESAILLTYLKYLETASATNSDINDLEKRYKLFLQTVKDFTAPCLHLSFQAIGINLNSVTSELANKLNKFKLVSQHYNNRLYLTFAIPFITAPTLLFDFESGAWDQQQHAYNPNASLNLQIIDLFEKKTIINRIYLVTMLDNLSLLKSFLEEYSTHNPNTSIMDFITSRSLVGLAAANGCIKVMQYFIELKVSLEQKFTLNTSLKTIWGSNSKSTLAHPNYTTCILEMTPLALALSTASALKREEARNMIELLLTAGANYNTKIIKTWAYTHGYYTNQQTSQKASSINLFSFDQTGLLDELVKKLREAKAQPKSRQEKGHNRNQPKKVFPTNNHAKDGELQLTIEQLKKLNLSLEEEVNKLRQENAALKKEVETLKTSVPKSSIDAKQVITIQKLFRKYHARKNHSLIDLKRERKKEVLEKSSEIMGKLAKEGKFDQITELATAIKDEKYHEAMQIIRGIPEQVFELDNGLKIKY